MRYLGSKIKLLSSIDEVIKENNIEGETFADLFAGTGCVGDFFKDRYQIISNDFLFYSYVMNRAKLKNDSIPKFDCFRKKYKSDIFEWLNTQTYIPDDSYFIYLNYTPIGNRMFFTEENGIKIDGIRQKIEELRAKNIIDEEEYYYLIASMIESITKVSNISGTYEAFFKFWDSRAEKDFDLQPLEINEAQLHANNLIFNEDTNKLVREIKGDIAYIDPPYTVTQYISAYHMFETLARYDYPTIKGVGGKRGRGDKNSLYAQRTKAKLIFEDLFRQIQFKHILISYSNQGLVPIEELCELASNFAVNGAVKINHYDYREYQNHRSSNKRNTIDFFSDFLTMKKTGVRYYFDFPNNIDYVIRQLNLHQSRMFKDTQKHLVKSMIEFFEQFKGKSKGGKVHVKIRYFDMIWQCMISKYLNRHFAGIDPCNGAAVFDEGLSNSVISFSQKRFTDIDLSHNNFYIDVDHEEQRKQLNTLLTRGYLERPVFAEAHNKLITEYEHLTAKRDMLYRMDDAGYLMEQKLKELVDFLNGAEPFTEWDDSLFERFVEKVKVLSRDEVEFELKFGLRLKERID